MMYFEKLSRFIEDFNSHAEMKNFEEDKVFFETYELDMAKAFLLDESEVAVRVSKIILALKDVNDIKIKIE